MKKNSAYTLLEVIIAVALFSTLLVAVIETSVGILSYTDQNRRLLELEQEGREILKQVSADLSNSGPYNEPGQTSFPLTPPIDSANSPYGNSIQFLRIVSTARGGGNGVELFNFANPITPMSGFANPSNTINGLIVNKDYVLNVGKLTGPVWEKNNADRPLGITDWNYNRDLRYIKIYSYEVESSPNFAYGTLVRKYSVDGGRTFNRDMSIPELGRGHVYSFVIEQTTGTQRIRLHLELISQNFSGSGDVKRTFESIITMRTQ